MVVISGLARLGKSILSNDSCFSFAKSRVEVVDKLFDPNVSNLINRLCILVKKMLVESLEPFKWRKRRSRTGQKTTQP